ncbi:tail fiber protein [Methylobacillus glycogenes]|uniref:tail fiber protein n=1 Tax=Methylobacillus glycogenes TaxID=406 RepID=UPI0004712613|nr:tail fiber protein [Methylobacillus glycogenes]
MAALTEQDQFVPEIYQIEMTDDALGGDGEDAIANRQGKQLASRTRWLYNKVQDLLLWTLSHISASHPHPQYLLQPEIVALIDAKIATVVGLKVGTVISITGDFDPVLFADYLVVPTAPTLISRADYPELFARWLTKYGAGDGATTFGMYFLPANYAQVQASAGNAGTQTVGEVIAHPHAGGGAPVGAFAGPGSVGLGVSATGSTGGPANLAAGTRTIFLVKFR